MCRRSTFSVTFLRFCRHSYRPRYLLEQLEKEIQHAEIPYYYLNNHIWHHPCFPTEQQHTVILNQGEQQ